MKQGMYATNERIRRSAARALRGAHLVGLRDAGTGLFSTVGITNGPWPEESPL